MKLGSPSPSLYLEQIVDNVTASVTDADVSVHSLLINILKGKVPISALLEIKTDALNWNISAKEGKYKDQTTLYLLLRAACAGKEEALTVLAKIVENKTLNWNVQLKYENNNYLNDMVSPISSV